MSDDSSSRSDAARAYRSSDVAARGSNRLSNIQKKFATPGFGLEGVSAAGDATLVQPRLKIDPSDNGRHSLFQTLLNKDNKMSEVDDSDESLKVNCTPKALPKPPSTSLESSTDIPAQIEFNNFSPYRLSTVGAHEPHSATP